MSNSNDPLDSIGSPEQQPPIQDYVQEPGVDEVGLNHTATMGAPKKSKRFFYIAVGVIGLIAVFMGVTLMKAMTAPSAPPAKKGGPGGPMGAAAPGAPGLTPPPGMGGMGDMAANQPPIGQAPAPAGSGSLLQPQPQAQAPGGNTLSIGPGAQQPVPGTPNPGMAQPAPQPQLIAQPQTQTVPQQGGTLAPQAPAPASGSADSGEVDAMRARIAQLEQENQALRRNGQAPAKAAAPKPAREPKPVVKSSPPVQKKAIARLEDAPVKTRPYTAAAKEAEVARSNKAEIAAEAPATPQPAQSWSLRGISNGVAWISDGSGRLINVVVGDVVPGLGPVTQIDDENKTAKIGRSVLR